MINFVKGSSLLNYFYLLNWEFCVITHFWAFIRSSILESFTFLMYYTEIYFVDYILLCSRRHFEQMSSAWKVKAQNQLATFVGEPCYPTRCLPYCLQPCRGSRWYYQASSTAIGNLIDANTCCYYISVRGKFVSYGYVCILDFWSCYGKLQLHICTLGFFYIVHFCLQLHCACQYVLGSIEFIKICSIFLFGSH